MRNEFVMPGGFVPQLQYVVLIPLFFLLFMLVYEPFSLFEELSGLGGRSEYFHLFALSAIVLVTLALSRLFFSAILKIRELIWIQYFVWCAFELLALSLFVALYFSLFARQSYFLSLPSALKYICLSLIFPYVFFLLRRALVVKNESLQALLKAEKPSLFKFFDEHKKLKFTIDPKNLAYIAAESNYIKLYYLENERVKEFLLRSSMKSLEESAPKHGLVRCHRSYYLNPKFVKLLSRSSDGSISAELSYGPHKVPVSKQYYGTLAELI